MTAEQKLELLQAKLSMFTEVYQMLISNDIEMETPFTTHAHNAMNAAEVAVDAIKAEWDTFLERHKEAKDTSGSVVPFDKSKH